MKYLLIVLSLMLSRDVMACSMSMLGFQVMLIRDVTTDVYNVSKATKDQIKKMRFGGPTGETLFVEILNSGTCSVRAYESNEVSMCKYVTAEVSTTEVCE